MEFKTNDGVRMSIFSVTQISGIFCTFQNVTVVNISPSLPHVLLENCTLSMYSPNTHIHMGCTTVGACNSPHLHHNHTAFAYLRNAALGILSAGKLCCEISS